MSQFTTFKTVALNFFGAKIPHKTIVFESDDWGMIRTSSLDAFQTLDERFPLSQCVYSSNDALERDSDVNGLIEVLDSNRSQASENSSPKFTLNYVMFNPDFGRIEKFGFQKYYRESCLTTYANYGASDNVLDLVKHGATNGFFMPQFHATEHININNWMLSLQQGDESTLNAFQHSMANLHRESQSNCPKEHLDAFGYRDNESTEALEETVLIGLNAFKEVFGFTSKTMIAPCYLWDSRLEKAAMHDGIKAFQGGTVQKIPTANGFEKRRHYMGQRGKQGQRYFIRNCQFERVDNPLKDWVNSCLRDIEMAFRFKKPAIISTHRVNYMGRLNENNRSEGLKQLDLLLKEINKKWPDVEYLSTPELLEKYYS